jgi:C-terminal processing protease CtpA/Prc
MGENDTPADFMKKFSTDRWSFASTSEKETEWDEGFESNLGIFAVMDTDKMLIAYTDHDSPAASAGYMRGDEILLTRDYGTGKNYVYIKKPSGLKIANTVHGEKHLVDTVFHKIIRQDGINVGYLWLKDFNKAAVRQIRSAFQEFKEKGVNEIILDLRYNGGGHADAMLANLIVGEANAGKVFFTLKHADKYRDQDSTVY